MNRTGEICIYIARRAISRGVRSGERPPVRDCLPDEPTTLPLELRSPRACFITLKKHARLRGCMGNIEPKEPLYENVALNAYRAARHDPRFPPVHDTECGELSIQVSVLSALEPIPFDNEAELRRLLRPGDDGLLIRAGSHQATFLPAVWEMFDEPAQFLRELKRKARLHPDRVAAGLEAFRYTTESFQDSFVPF